MGRLIHKAIEIFLLLVVMAAVVVASVNLSYGWFSQEKTVKASGISVQLVYDSGAEIGEVIGGAGGTGGEFTLMPGGFLIYIIDNENAEEGIRLLSIMAQCGSISYPDEVYNDYNGNAVNRFDVGYYCYRTEDGSIYLPDESVKNEFFEENFRFPAAYALKCRSFALTGTATNEQLMAMANAVEWNTVSSLVALPEPAAAENFTAGETRVFSVNADLTEGFEPGLAYDKVAVVLYFDPYIQMSTEVAGTVYTMEGSNPFMAQALTIGFSQSEE